MKSSLTRTLSRLSHSDRFVSELIVASKDRSRQTTNAPEVAVQGAQGRCSVLNSTLGPRHSTLPSTRGGTRTPTPSRETDFESVASTDSATRACRTTPVRNAARRAPRRISRTFQYEAPPQVPDAPHAPSASLTLAHPPTRTTERNLPPSTFQRSTAQRWQPIPESPPETPSPNHNPSPQLTSIFTRRRRGRLT